MARYRSNLVKIEVECNPSVEEAVADTVSNIFGINPFSVDNHESGKFLICAFFPVDYPLTPEKKRLLKKHLDKVKDNSKDPGPLKVRYSIIKNEDWTESWRHHFKPIVFGETLVVKPPWEGKLNIPAAKNVIIDPGLAFGTGNHPTTLFCLQQIVKFRPQKTRASMLDIGTGSGILAIAAAKLGYSPVTAFDSDPIAVEVAARNAKRNRVIHKINLYVGDILKMRKNSPEKYDLICANISDDVLIQAASIICSRLNVKGRLAVSGIMEKNFNSVLTTFTGAGLELLNTKKEKQWKSALFIKSS